MNRRISESETRGTGRQNIPDVVRSRNQIHYTTRFELEAWRNSRSPESMFPTREDALYQNKKLARSTEIEHDLTKHRIGAVRHLLQTTREVLSLARRRGGSAWGVNQTGSAGVSEGT